MASVLVSSFRKRCGPCLAFFVLVTFLLACHVIYALSRAYIELCMHAGGLEGPQIARVALSYASSYSYAVFVLSKLPACIRDSIYVR